MVMRLVQQTKQHSSIAKALLWLQYRHISHIKGVHSLAQSAALNCVRHHSGKHLQSSNRQGFEVCAGSWVRQTVSFAVSEKLNRRAQACMATVTSVEPSKTQPQAGWPLAAGMLSLLYHCAFGVLIYVVLQPLPAIAVATMTSIGDQEANFATCERLAKVGAACNPWTAHSDL